MPGLLAAHHWRYGKRLKRLEVVPPDAPPPTFMTRPSSSAITVSGGSNILIEDVSISGSANRDAPGSGRAITVTGATNVTIRNVDFQNIVGGIYLYDCTGTLLIEGCRGRNIGDNTIGSGASNHIQLAESVMSGYIRQNKFLGGLTEDMISLWHSGGTGVGGEIIVEDNQFQGLVTDTADARAWTSTSGTGIILGDGSGSAKNGYYIVRDNTFLTPGQVGIQHIDGPGIQTYSNIIYGQKRVSNNNPITSWEGSPEGVIHDNRYYWINNDDSLPSPWMHEDPSGMVLTDNIKDATLDPADYVVDLDVAPPVGDTFASVVAGLDPTAWWRLGESSGTTATDEQGVQNGTYVNGPTLGIGGITTDGDTAVRFAAASSQYVTIADHAGLDVGTSDFTIMAGVSVTGSWPSLSQIIYCRGGVGAGAGFYALILRGGSTGDIRLYMAGTSYQWSTGSSGWVNAGWRLLICAVDRSDKAHLYLDGSEVGTGVDVSAQAAVDLTDNDIAAIAADENGGLLLDHDVDEVAYWNGTLLTASDASTLYGSL